MKLRTIVLLATLMSIGNLQAQYNEPQALSQFTIDVILNMGFQNGLDTLMKYKESDKFYINERELFNLGQILYRQGRQDDAIAFMNFANNEFPKLQNSVAQKVFMMLVEDGAEATQNWFDNNRDYNGYYLNENEFDMATTTFLRASEIDKCKVINTIYLNEFPDNQEAHFQMADICDAEGNTELALQYFRSGVRRDALSNGKIS